MDGIVNVFLNNLLGFDWIIFVMAGVNVFVYYLVLRDPRILEIRAKINKWDLMKLKGFCTTKETIIIISMHRIVL